MNGFYRLSLIETKPVQSDLQHNVHQCDLEGDYCSLVYTTPTATIFLSILYMIDCMAWNLMEISLNYFYHYHLCSHLNRHASEKQPKFIDIQFCLFTFTYDDPVHFSDYICLQIISTY